MESHGPPGEVLPAARARSCAVTRHGSSPWTTPAEGACGSACAKYIPWYSGHGLHSQQQASKNPGGLHPAHLDRGGIHVVIAGRFICVECVHSWELAAKCFHCPCLAELITLREAHIIYDTAQR